MSSFNGRLITGSIVFLVSFLVVVSFRRGVVNVVCASCGVERLRLADPPREDRALLVSPPRSRFVTAGESV